MKNKSNANIYSGIKITDNISVSIPKKNNIFDFLALIMIALLGCFGTINAFVSMFNININLPILNFYIILFFSIFSVIFILPGKTMLILLPTALCYELIIYKNWDKFTNGFMLVCNQTYRTIWPQRSDYFKIDTSKIDSVSDTKFFICLTVFILTSLICYISIVKPNFFFGFILTFPFVEIGLFYGKAPELVYIIFLVFYWVSLLAVDQSGYYKSTGRLKTGFIRKGNTFISKPAIRFRTAGQSGIIMLLFSVLIMAGAFMFVKVSDYTRSDNLNAIRSNVKTAVSEFTFNDISGSLERISSSFKIGNIKSYSHRLGNFNSISYSGKTDLTVSASGVSQVLGNIYLKGYVGSVYDGKSWDIFNNSVYEDNAYLFKNFSDSTYPQDLLFVNYGEFLSDIYMPLINVRIKSSLFNPKYTYTPYNSRSLENISYIYDMRTESSDKKEYEFEVSPYQSFESLLSNNETNLLNNSVYTDFVYQNYLDVPNNSETEKLYDMYIDGHQDNDIYAQLTYIKSILSENAQYTLSPGRTPSGKDFVSYFLTENHKGYCVHFATAGIILARMSGIPARYADGYVLLEDDFSEDNKTSDGYEINIKDERAHAWAEIYVDSYGWIPFEFTPSSAATFNNDTEIESTENSTTTPRTSVTKSDKSNITISQNSNSKTEIKRLSTIQEELHKYSGINLSLELKIFFSTLFLFVLLISGIIIVHIVVIKKRNKSFNTTSYSRNAINAYDYIIKLLEFYDIKNDNMQYLEFAEFAEQNPKRIFKSNEFSEITQIALEARMSNTEIDKEKSLKVIRFAEKTAHIIFAKSNFILKIYMKFIKNLI